MEEMYVFIINEIYPILRKRRL